MARMAIFEPKPWLELYQKYLPVTPSEKVLKSASTQHPGQHQGNEEEAVIPSVCVTSLPSEVLTAIFSLLEPEQLSTLAQVCGTFLAYAYDPTHWRRIALRTWPNESVKDLEKQLYKYKTWRKLCIQRPSLRTNAIYVTRHQFTKTASRSAAYEPLAPVFLVTYYRFLRFYADGTVVSLTTPDPPEHAFRRLRRAWKPSVQERDKAYPNVGQYELNEDTMEVSLTLPMRQPRFPNMRGGTMFMRFSLSQTKQGAYDRLFLIDHHAVMDHDGGDLVSYSSELFGGKPFRLIPIWGFKRKVYLEFPRDDHHDLAQWYEMKKQARKAQKRDSAA